MSLTEFEFASTFLKLLSDSPIVIEDNYKKELNSINVLPKFPNLPSVYKNNSISSNVKCSFKSIKAPKFQIDLELDENETIKKVKEVLAAKIPELQDLVLKFLIKGKVIQDSNLIGSLGEDLKFTVMTSKPEPTIAQTEQEEEPEPEPEMSIPWDEISIVLQNSGIIDINSTLNRLKKGWELTSS